MAKHTLRDTGEWAASWELSRRRVVTLAGAAAVKTGIDATGVASAHSADRVVFCDCDALCVENLVGNADVVVYDPRAEEEREEFERHRIEGEGERLCFHLERADDGGGGGQDGHRGQQLLGDDVEPEQSEQEARRSIVAVAVGPGDGGRIYCNPNECAAAGRDAWDEGCDEEGDIGTDCRRKDCSVPATFQQCGKLVGDDTGEFSLFGEAVTIGDRVAVAGAPFDDTEAGPNTGAVYAFERDGGGWTQVQRLTASDGESDDGFGSSVSLDGDSLLVGAPGTDNASGQNAGAAYVFERNGTWTEVAKLVAPDGGAFDEFGFSVSVRDGWALVGAPFEDPGAVYVFERDGGWTQVQRLTASDGEPGDRFGQAISLDGDTSLIGTPGDSNANGPFAGAAYVFERNGAWTEVAKLVAPDGVANDRFGSSVSVWDGVTIVGAPFDENENGPVAGSAYVFERDGAWNFVERLIARDGEEGQWFGWDVSLYCDTALVGAPAEDHDELAESGAAYLFTSRDGGWSQTQRLVADDAAQFASFGEGVSLFGDQLLVGAPFDENERGSNAGAAYPFCALDADG